MHVKVLLSEKVCAKGSYSPPTEDTAPALPETPGLEFTSVTYVHHYVTDVMSIFIYSHYKIYRLQSISRHTVATTVAELF